MRGGEWLLWGSKELVRLRDCLLRMQRDLYGGVFQRGREGGHGDGFGSFLDIATKMFGLGRQILHRNNPLKEEYGLKHRYHICLLY